jgi:DNA-directed RNA polymerase subunit beta'
MKEVTKVSKVQSFILNSVQSVYQSQGVTINDKHLEVIIKQMTTKVLITHEGNTPLLRRVIDLYHIKYINEIIDTQGKQSACYVPLLLGITKAALNNPSFISAASFQETTRVLTKAAIEGRIDWLRGLKEHYYWTLNSLELARKIIEIVLKEIFR